MIRRLVAAGLLGLSAVLLLPVPAQAHPLGNFTTNTYAGLRIGASGVDVDFVLDLAELPAYQATTNEIDTNHDGTPAVQEQVAYAEKTCTAAAAATTVTVNKTSIPLQHRIAGVQLPPGAGGLTTLRLSCVLHAPARINAEATITFATALYAERIGWREVTAVGDRYTLSASDVPATSISNRLTAYPPGAATSDVRGANLTVRPGGPPAPAGVPAFASSEGGSVGGSEGGGDDGSNGGAQARDVDRLTAWFTGLVGHPTLTLGVGILSVLIAIVLGGAHAIAPGHGKTIMAAYLVGSKGRLAPALTVAGSVAVTHTLGVLTLGVVLATSVQLAPETLYTWLKLVSGVLVALIGAQLLRRAIRSHRARVALLHAHPPAARDHHHDETHPHDHHHHETHTHDHHHHDDDALVVAGATQPAAETATATAGVSAPMTAAAPHHHDQAPHHHDHDHGPAHTHEPARSPLTGPIHAHGIAHTHDHGDGRTHTHYIPAPDEPLRIRTLLAMGFAGGLSPSPSAVVVLLGAAALGRAWYGVVLVIAYGIGLAATLTGIGFALARWGNRLSRLSRLGGSRWQTLLISRMPAATASIILAVGVGMTVLATAGLVL